MLLDAYVLPCPQLCFCNTNMAPCPHCMLLQNLKFPLLENKNEWHIHGYAYGNYLTELNPPGQVFARGASLDKAFEGARRCQFYCIHCTALAQQTQQPLLTSSNVHAC
jgi:hypothetical protein